MKRKIYCVCFALVILAGTTSSLFAQGVGSSVMIYNNTKQGTENNSVGNAFEQALIKGLEDKYPCVDWMNEQVLADAIQKLREREAATGELDEKALAELGNSVNASQIIVVRVFTLGNGQTVVSARVIDGKGAATVADRIENSAGGESAYRAAQSVAQKILQDLATTFRGQCEARWTGTITYTQKTLKEKNETTALTKINKIETKYSENYEQKIEATLQPMAQGSKTNFFTNGQESMTMSRVFRKYLERVEQVVTETGEEACRQRGANPYRKQFTSRDNKTINEEGDSTKTLPVAIKVYTDTGRFVVKVATPDLLLKETEVHDGVRDFCPPQPFSETKSSERTDTASFFDFEGQVDPKNPNVLAGKKVTGTLETRQYTTTWNLRLVQPRKKQ
jgi:hypothetical protein